MLNSIGLANPGRERFLAETLPAAARARRAALGLGRRLRRATSTRETCARARRRDDRAEPLVPERRRGAGERRPRSSPRAARRRRCRSTRSSRRTRGTSPRPRARSRRRAPTAISLVNTMRGLALDARLRPRLARGAGGYSGPALKPVALAAVYACAARDGAADRRHGRGVDRARRARADRVRRDPRRARHGALRRPGRAAARSRRASRRCERTPASTTPKTRFARPLASVASPRQLPATDRGCTTLRGW